MDKIVDKTGAKGTGEPTAHECRAWHSTADNSGWMKSYVLLVRFSWFSYTSSGHFVTWQQPPGQLVPYQTPDSVSLHNVPPFVMQASGQFSRQLS